MILLWGYNSSSSLRCFYFTDLFSFLGYKKINLQICNLTLLSVLFEFSELSVFWTACIPGTDRQICRGSPWLEAAQCIWRMNSPSRFESALKHTDTYRHISTFIQFSLPWLLQSLSPESQSWKVLFGSLCILKCPNRLQATSQWMQFVPTKWCHLNARL